MADAVHLGSGKVRELYALGDDRLLLVASDRISTFDVVLPTEIPDKGRVLTGLSAFWFARTRSICPNHLLALARGRALDGVPAAAACCRSSAWCAATSRAPGWKDYRRDGRGLRPPAAGRAARVRPAARADLHPGHQGRRPATTRTSRARRPRALVGAERFAEAERLSIALYRFAARVRARPRHHHRRHQVRVRHRRGRAARARRRGAHARLVALLAGRPVRARRPAAVVRQAVRARLLRDRPAGTRRIRVPRCPPTSSRARGRATSRRSSASPGSPSTGTWRTRRSRWGDRRPPR